MRVPVEARKGEERLTVTRVAVTKTCATRSVWPVNFNNCPFFEILYKHAYLPSTILAYRHLEIYSEFRYGFACWSPSKDTAENGDGCLERRSKTGLGLLPRVLPGFQKFHTSTSWSGVWREEDSSMGWTKFTRLPIHEGPIHRALSNGDNEDNMPPKDSAA